MTKEYNYYQDELDKIRKDLSVVVKFTDSLNNSTKFMSINKGNIDIFINFLQELKNRMS